MYGQTTGKKREGAGRPPPSSLRHYMQGSQGGKGRYPQVSRGRWMGEYQPQARASHCWESAESPGDAEAWPWASHSLAEGSGSSTGLFSPNWQSKTLKWSLANNLPPRLIESTEWYKDWESVFMSLVYSKKAVEAGEPTLV